MSDFESIYQQYGKTVYFFLLSLTQNESLSEELTQETMCRAIMNIGAFCGESKMSVWLCQIAKNLYFEWQKRISVMSLSKMRFSPSQMVWTSKRS